MRALILLLFAAGIGTTWSQKAMTSRFPLKWKTPIGITTYRTNMISHKGIIYIGSNGKNREAKIDEQDGVYAIDAKTGKIKHVYKVPFAGDNDVTGIAIAADKLFFGTDNYYFFCYDLGTQEELWKFPVPYDVESAPVTEDFNGDGIQDVSFSVQSNGFYALNGKDGSVIWMKDSLDAYNGNVSSLLVDLDGDGVKDIVNAGSGTPDSDEIDGFKMAHYGNYHMAMNGKTGAIMWILPSGAGIHNSPFLFNNKGEQQIALLDCYGQFQVVDFTGKVRSRAEFGYPHFNSPVMTKDQHLVIGPFSIQYADEFLTESRDEEDPAPYLNDKAKLNSVAIDGKISATTMIADVLGNGTQQAIGVSEDGVLFIMKTDGTPIQTYKLGPKGAEASVFIKDIDGDGKLEILVANLDGFLYCYSTNSTGKVEVGAFR